MTSRRSPSRPATEIGYAGAREARSPRYDFGVGVDFGTSNSVAAIFDGRAVTVVLLDGDRAIMPSASYIDRSFSVATGRDAIQAYIEDNQGRRVEYRSELLGEGRVSTGQVDPGSGLPTAASTEAIYGRELEDAGLPGRLFHGTKRLLGNRDSERIVVFGRPFRLVALVTPILVEIKRAVDLTLASELGKDQAATHACIGFPVNFEGSEAGANARALARLGEAYRHAGIADQRFCPEPVAAAIAYLHANPRAGARRALSVDFGGGTLDLCIIGCRDTTLEIEAVHGIALGGDRIDQTLFRELLFPMLGENATWRRVVDGRPIETPFPFWIYEERLLNWQVTYTLNQNKYTTPLLDQMSVGGVDATALQRLYHLIAQNYGYQAFRHIRRLKERLSSAPADDLDIPEIDVHRRLTRGELEAMIAEHLQRFADAVDETLRRARLESTDIDVVLRTGGSALIPAFAKILNTRFAGKVVERDPFTSVAAGLAIADYFGLGEDAW